MQLSKLASAVVVSLLGLVSVELFVEAILRGFSQPSMLVVLGVLAAGVLALALLARRRGGPSSTPYW